MLHGIKKNTLEVLCKETTEPMDVIRQKLIISEVYSNGNANMAVASKLFLDCFLARALTTSTDATKRVSNARKKNQFRPKKKKKCYVYSGHALSFEIASLQACH